MASPSVYTLSTKTFYQSEVVSIHTQLKSSTGHSSISAHMNHLKSEAHITNNLELIFNITAETLFSSKLLNK